MDPQGLACASVDRRRAVERRAQIHTIDHQGCGDERPDRWSDTCLGDAIPGRPQVWLLRLKDVEERVGRDQGVAVGGRVHQMRIDRRPAPEQLEIAEVLPGHLTKSRILRASGISCVAPPFSIRGALLRRDRARGQTHRHDHNGHRTPIDRMVMSFVARALGICDRGATQPTGAKTSQMRHHK